MLTCVQQPHAFRMKLQEVVNSLTAAVNGLLTPWVSDSQYNNINYTGLGYTSPPCIHSQARPANALSICL